jgi:hypothetical protein
MNVDPSNTDNTIGTILQITDLAVYYTNRMKEGVFDDRLKIETVRIPICTVIVPSFQKGLVFRRFLEKVGTLNQLGYTIQYDDERFVTMYYVGRRFELIITISVK